MPSVRRRAVFLVTSAVLGIAGVAYVVGCGDDAGGDSPASDADAAVDGNAAGDDGSALDGDVTDAGVDAKKVFPNAVFLLDSPTFSPIPIPMADAGSPSIVTIIDGGVASRVVLDPGFAFGLAVSEDGETAYVARDGLDAGLAIVTAAGIARVGVPPAQSVVLSPDGTKVWLTAGNALVSVDRKTLATRTIPTAPNVPIALTVAADGTVVALAIESFPSMKVVVVGPGDVTPTIAPLNANVAPGIPIPDALGFVGPSLVLLRDGNSDAFYSFDVATKQVVTGSEIKMVNNGGAYGAAANRFAASPVLKRAWSMVEDGTFVEVDPVAKTTRPIADAGGVVTTSVGAERVYFTNGEAGTKSVAIKAFVPASSATVDIATVTVDRGAVAIAVHGTP